MSAEDNGGPAYPTEVGPGPDGGFQCGNERWKEPGMSLRDYFAAKALTGVMHMVATRTHDTQRFDGSTPEESMARDAYRIADAMLKARAQ